MKSLVFCTLIGVAVAATYGRLGGQASLPAYQAAVPLAGDSYEPQELYRPSTNKYQKQQKNGYIPPAYQNRNTYIPPAYQSQRENKPQRYQPQKVYKYPVNNIQEQYRPTSSNQELQNSYRQNDYEEHQEYKPEVYQQQNEYKPAVYRQSQIDARPSEYQPQQYRDYSPPQNYEPQQYSVHEDFGPDMSNFRYHVPIYDAKGYGNAAVKVNRFPGGATYQLDENAYGSDVKINFETAPSGRQAYPKY